MTSPLASLLYAGLRCFQRRDRLSVLVFHRVLKEPDPLRPGHPTAAEFEEALTMLRAGFHVVSLAEGLAGLDAGTLPRGSVALTFDDGYRDNLTLAVPALARSGMTATFFVATGYADGGWMWNDRVIEAIGRSKKATLDLGDEGLGAHSLARVEDRVAAVEALLPRIKYLPPVQRDRVVDRMVDRCGVRLGAGPMLSVDEIRAMHRQGMEIGAHTRSHPILTQVGPAEAQAEILGSRRDLEDWLQAPVAYFAYPNGRYLRDYDDTHVEAVRAAGFRAAVATRLGTAVPGTIRFRIPRFAPPRWAPFGFWSYVTRSRERV